MRFGRQEGGRDLVARGEVRGDADIGPARAGAGELVLQVVRLKLGRLEEDAHAVVLAEVEGREPAVAQNGGRRFGTLRPVGDVLVVGRSGGRPGACGVIAGVRGRDDRRAYAV